MPYILNNDRKELDIFQGGERISHYLSMRNIHNFAGELNYLNFKIVKTYIKVNGKKYFTFAVIFGTLICCIFEIYRKLVAPYEEKKILENGNIKV